MDQRVVERGIENAALLRGPSFDADPAEVGGPLRAGGGMDLFEIEALLLRIEVFPGIVDADKGDADLQQHLLPGLQLVEMEPVTDVVSGELAGIGGVELVLPGIAVPGGLGRHRALLFPVAGTVRKPVDAKDEIDREHGLAVVAEGSHELGALNFDGADPAESRSAFIGQALAEVHEDTAPAAREGVLFEGGPAGGGQFGTDAAGKIDAVVARACRFVLVSAAVDMVVDLQGAGCRHRQDGTEIGAADTGEIDVRKAGKIPVLMDIGRAPPLAVLVAGVERRAHDIEGRYAHHPVRGQGAGVAGAVVCGPDEGIDAVDRLLRKKGQGGQRQGRKQGEAFHHSWIRVPS